MENISIEINKDFGRFKNNFFIGFTLQEFLCIIVALIVCAVIILPLALILHVDLIIAGYLGMGPAVIIIYCGFYEKEGLTFFEFRQKTKALKGMKRLCYESEESMETLMLLMEEEQQEVQKRLQEIDAFDKKTMKRKKAFQKAFCMIGLLVVSAVAAVFAFHGVKKAVKSQETFNGKKEQMAEQMKKKESTEKVVTTPSSVTVMTTAATTTTAKKKKATTEREQESVVKAETSKKQSVTVKASQKARTAKVATTQQKKESSVSSGTRKKKKRSETKSTAKRKNTSHSTTEKKNTTESVKNESNEFQVDYSIN